MSTAPSNSFMITNREWAGGLRSGIPIADGRLMWFSAPGANVADTGQFSADSRDSSTRPSPTYTDAIVAQLQAQKAPSLTLFIHGLDCVWESAVAYTGGLGSSLAAHGYPGLVIGYSWPSEGKLDLVSYSNGYPPDAATSTVRGKIAYGAANVVNLMAWLAVLQSLVTELVVNVVCHSEGNFALMWSLTKTATTGLNQVVMLAADINDGAFLSPNNDLMGQGAGIVAAASQITVYFTRGDYILGFSMAAFGANFPIIDILGGGAYHNPYFAGRLGLSGPAYGVGQQAGNVVSVDCSEVLNDTALSGTGSTGIGIHSAYFVVDQVMADIAAVLQGQQADSIQNRSNLANAGAYLMTPTAG